MRSLEFWSISSYFIVICNKLEIRIATYIKTNIKKARASLLYFKRGKLQTSTMCVIFTILASFSRDNALFASKVKIIVV